MDSSPENTPGPGRGCWEQLCTSPEVVLVLLQPGHSLRMLLFLGFQALLSLPLLLCLSVLLCLQFPGKVLNLFLQLLLLFAHVFQLSFHGVHLLQQPLEVFVDPGEVLALLCGPVAHVCCREVPSPCAVLQRLLEFAESRWDVLALADAGDGSAHLVEAGLGAGAGVTGAQR